MDEGVGGKGTGLEEKGGGKEVELEIKMNKEWEGVRHKDDGERGHGFT